VSGSGYGDSTALRLWQDCGFRRESKLHPGLESAGQRTNLPQTGPFELQRHPGARRFAWSSAVEDNFVSRWNLVRPGAQFRRPHNLGAFDLQPGSPNIDRSSQVHEGHFCFAVH
jgi:hypothetical protein